MLLSHSATGMRIAAANVNRGWEKETMSDVRCFRPARGLWLNVSCFGEEVTLFPLSSRRKRNKRNE